MGKGAGTIGFHYLGTLLFGLGRGPSNELVAIKVGGKMAWEGHKCDSAPGIINKPDLFGGEQKEGGIQGVFGSFMGAPDQVLPGAQGPIAVGTKGPYQVGTLPDLKATIASAAAPNVGEFRGRHVFLYDGLLSSMNPYIKTWEFRRRRTTAGWMNDECWYEAKASIWLSDGAICAMNPAHIVYQALTDKSWGRGLPTGDLDDNSFTYAANTFCNESFGLCMQWMRRDEIGTFIQSVMDHAGASLYTDRSTGLINFVPTRGDYNIDNLPHFDMESGLLSVYEDDSGSANNVSDEIIVEGLDPVSGQAIEGRAYNLAIRNFIRGGATALFEFPGLPTVELCNRVAERERNLGGAGLRKFTLKFDRAGFRLFPGGVFKFSYAPRNISNLVVRVGEIDDGDMASGTITVRVVQDVFGLPSVAFVKGVPNTYDGQKDPEPAVAEVFEASYRDAYVRLSEADLNTVTEGESFLAAVAEQPNGYCLNYNLRTRAEGESDFTDGNYNFFTPAVVLAADINKTVETFTAVDGNLVPDDVVGMGAWCGDEYLKITAYDPATLKFSVLRGAVDTWPKVHAAGTRVWFVDDDIGLDSRTYQEGETVEAVVLPRTSEDELPLIDAEILSTVMQGRPFRPYPPAKVTVGGQTILGSTVVQDGPVEWVDRNRVTQADKFVAFVEPTVAAEAGTTYEIDILDTDLETVINTYEVTSPWLYDGTMQADDGTTALVTVPVRIYAVRDGVRSLPQAVFYVRGGLAPGGGAGDGTDSGLKCGYGYDYGNNYGGGCGGTSDGPPNDGETPPDDPDPEPSKYNAMPGATKWRIVIENAGTNGLGRIYSMDFRTSLTDDPDKSPLSPMHGDGTVTASSTNEGTPTTPFTGASTDYWSPGGAVVGEYLELTFDGPVRIGFLGHTIPADEAVNAASKYSLKFYDEYTSSWITLYTKDNSYGYGLYGGGYFRDYFATLTDGQGDKP